MAKTIRERLEKTRDAPTTRGLWTYQTRLQGVANDLAAKIRELLDDADAETAKILRRGYRESDGDVKAAMKRLEKLLAEIESARGKLLDDARELTIETGREVANAASDEARAKIRERLDADKERRRRSIKTLTSKQVDAILDYAPFAGASIRQTFKSLRASDLASVVAAVQTGAVEGLSVAGIVKKILGDKKTNGEGATRASRVAANRLARTTINGVSNAARIETLRENADAIDGIQFLATLDGRTSPICASLDGRIWRVDEIDSAPRPPLHPNCRSTIIPYVESRDPETGKVLDEGKPIRDENGKLAVSALERPAANADFDALAKKKYDADAKARGSSRRWEDLAASTRKKYYYRAQSDWEEKNGKNAYRQTSVATSFKDYFDEQSKSFRREWLGEARFYAYNNEQITLDDLCKPNSNYVATIDDLRARGVYFEHEVVFKRDRKKSLEENLENIVEEMEREENEYVFPLLDYWKREMGPSEKREISSDFDDSKKEKFDKFRGVPNSSVDHCDVSKKTGEKTLKYRCYYDENGELEYQDDFWHTAENEHIFPHRHVFFKKAHSEPINARERKRK